MIDKDPTDEIVCTNLKHWKVGKKKSSGISIGLLAEERAPIHLMEDSLNNSPIKSIKVQLMIHSTFYEKNVELTIQKY